MVVFRVPGRFAERCNDVLRRGKVRIPDPEIDDINTFSLLFSFHLVDPGKKVRREIAHA
jgi:hypothetical protein